MKEVKRFRCDYCGKLMAKKDRMGSHEKECVHNAESVNCYRCECACITDWDYYNGSYESTRKNAPVCAYEEDIILENKAPICKMFRRSDKTNYERTYDEANDNTERIYTERDNPELLQEVEQ